MNKIIVLLFAISFSISAYAGDIQVENARARATAPGQETAMVDLTITSAKDAQLVGFSSTVCKSAQMHSMAHEDGMMKMREVEAIELPAGRRIALKESGYHLMLIGLQAPLKAGDSVPLTLSIKVAGKVEKVEAVARVQPMIAPMDMKRM